MLRSTPGWLRDAIYLLLLTSIASSPRVVDERLEVRHLESHVTPSKGIKARPPSPIPPNENCTHIYQQTPDFYLLWYGIPPNIYFRILTYRHIYTCDLTKSLRRPRTRLLILTVIFGAHTIPLPKSLLYIRKTINSMSLIASTCFLTTY